MVQSRPKVERLARTDGRGVILDDLRDAKRERLGDLHVELPVEIEADVPNIREVRRHHRDVAKRDGAVLHAQPSVGQERETRDEPLTFVVRDVESKVIVVVLRILERGAERSTEQEGLRAHWGVAEPGAHGHAALELLDPARLVARETDHVGVLDEVPERQRVDVGVVAEDAKLLLRRRFSPEPVGVEADVDAVRGRRQPQAALKVRVDLVQVAGEVIAAGRQAEATVRLGFVGRRLDRCRGRPDGDAERCCGKDPSRLGSACAGGRRRGSSEHHGRRGDRFGRRGLARPAGPREPGIDAGPRGSMREGARPGRRSSCDPAVRPLVQAADRQSLPVVSTINL